MDILLPETKVCSKCKLQKLLDKFYRDSHAKDGHEHRCETCAKKRVKDWRIRFPEKAHAQTKKYNAKRILTPNRSTHVKKYNDTHKEKRSAYNADYYLNHKNKILKYHKIYKANNKKKIKLDGRKYRTSTKGKISGSHSRYARRARERGLDVIEKIDRMQIYLRDNGMCHICKRKVAMKSFSLDHLIPIVHNGGHSAINVAIAHIICNARRGAGRIPAQLRLFG